MVFDWPPIALDVMLAHGECSGCRRDLVRGEVVAFHAISRRGGTGFLKCMTCTIDEMKRRSDDVRARCAQDSGVCRPRQEDRS